MRAWSSSLRPSVKTWRARAMDISPLPLLLLCPFGSLFQPPRRQAVALPPVVEPGFLVTPQPAVRGAALVLGAVAAQGALQDPRDQHPQLRHCQRGGLYFFPAWFPASGTRWQSATGSG